MDVTVDASYGKISLSADVSVARTKKDGAPITCIDRDGAALYYADGAIYLENGKSYSVGGAFPNYAELMDETAELCRTLTVTKSVDGQEKRYTLTAEGDDASTLLRLLTSDEIANAASLSASRRLRPEETVSSPAPSPSSTSRRFAALSRKNRSS